MLPSIGAVAAASSTHSEVSTVQPSAAGSVVSVVSPVVSPVVVSVVSPDVVSVVSSLPPQAASVSAPRATTAASVLERFVIEAPPQEV